MTERSLVSDLNLGGTTITRKQCSIFVVGPHHRDHHELAPGLDALGVWGTGRWARF